MDVQNSEVANNFGEVILFRPIHAVGFRHYSTEDVVTYLQGRSPGSVQVSHISRRRSRMARAIQLVSVLGRINPAIYDFIFPHGPVQAGGLASRLDRVALNPQPLPPEPPPERLQRVSAVIAHDIASAAIAMEAAGQDGGARIVSSAIDDWCGNGRPPIPIPWPGPWPFAFDPAAAPKDLDVAASRLVGALSFAAVATRMGSGKVREALSAGADKLLDASLATGAKQGA
jgi:hypothetical protein